MVTPPEFRELGKHARDFANAHPEQFPPDAHFLTGWQSENHEEQFANVLRRRRRESTLPEIPLPLSAVVAQIVSPEGLRERINVEWGQGRDPLKSRTFTSEQQGENGQVKADGLPSIERAKRIFTTLAEEMH